MNLYKLFISLQLIIGIVFIFWVVRSHKDKKINSKRVSLAVAGLFLALFFIGTLSGEDDIVFITKQLNLGKEADIESLVDKGLSNFDEIDNQTIDVSEEGIKKINFTYPLNGKVKKSTYRYKVVDNTIPTIFVKFNNGKEKELKSGDSIAIRLPEYRALEDRIEFFARNKTLKEDVPVYYKELDVGVEDKIIFKKVKISAILDNGNKAEVIVKINYEGGDLVE